MANYAGGLNGLSRLPLAHPIHLQTINDDLIALRVPILLIAFRVPILLAYSLVCRNIV